MDEGLLHVEDIDVGYPTAQGLRRVVDGLSLSLQAGQIGCLLGASGCGKTTVLRALAGFEPLQAGRIVLDGVCLSTAQAQQPPERRGVGMMFQDYALFPHLDVAANIGFGLRRLDKAARRARIAQMLDLVGLPDEGAAYPHELSGGQQQRIALARALAPAPKLLLLDEPFSNLDTDLRERLAAELRALLKTAGITALLVTHDQAEAFAMADVIGVMQGGRNRQWADAATLYRQPADRFVAGFIGRGSLLPATALGLPGDGDALVRPDQWLADPDGPIRAEVLSTCFRGPGQTLRLRLPGGEIIEADLPGTAITTPGKMLALRLAEHSLVRFPPEPQNSRSRRTTNHQSPINK